MRNTPITAIHIDDEQDSLHYMQELLQDTPEIILKGSFTSAAAAVAFLATTKVDLVFSDVEMPDKDGFWLASQLDRSQEIVFVTAYSAYAISAFEACALDYLLKPVQTSQLARVITKYQEKHLGASFEDRITELLNNYIPAQSYPHRIFINLPHLIRVVPLDEIVYLEASKSYTRIVLISGEKILASKTLKTYADVTDKHPDFIKIHRSYVVNKTMVRQMNRNGHRYFVTMVNNDKVEVSHSRREEIFDQLMH